MDTDFQTSDEEQAFRSEVAVHLGAEPLHRLRAMWFAARKYFGGDKAQRAEAPSVKNDHPIPDDLIMKGERLLRYFEFAHLPKAELRLTSHLFYNLAYGLVRSLPASAERTVALRKLLEAKDAAVRATLDMVNGVS